jgi:hypothetical protein
VPEVYDESNIETARDKLVTILNALKTTMASGYDPTFSYVYDGHNIGDLDLNAVTVDFLAYAPDHVGQVSMA